MPVSLTTPRGAGPDPNGIPVRFRLVGGPLSGQVVWLEQGRAGLTVQVAPVGTTPKRTLEYRCDGGVLAFVREVQL
ncbi:MAG TPA: hypothetical protein VD793_10355 [Gemmatimonadales bacterium]|nr:hypothetical protein [Gemmatimonadales bacterium]